MVLGGDSMKEVTIADRKIGVNHPPFIVAELSANHQQSLEEALKLVQAAKEAGADAIKLQTYTPHTITLNRHEGHFVIDDPNSPWRGKSFHNLYSEAHLPWEWHAAIFERCADLGIICFSSPFDESAVDFLEKLDTPCYKIASLEIIDLPLIRKAAATGKPLMISTGAASLSEIHEAVMTAREGGCRDLILLKCTSAYPASPEEAHLRTLPHLASSFEVPVGLSDHTAGIGVAIASIACGACVVEKHFTLSPHKGLDAAFSLPPETFRSLVLETKRAWESLGTITYGVTKGEKASHRYRPSLYFDADLPQGTVITAAHVRSVRPSGGLPPKEIDTIIGLPLTQEVKKGTPVQWTQFKKRER
jgi:pseudaminic acid synthase